MSGLSWHESPIRKDHDRASFDCGEPELNQFLAKFARQSHEAGAAKTFVASPEDDERRVLGYYSVCPASLEFAATPAVLRKGLARHDVPVFRLARLAVGRNLQGFGLGGALLRCAVARCLKVADEVGGVALLIDAKSESAAEWYQKFGAARLQDRPQSLLISFGTLRAIRPS